jgi:hypothetical protein
MLRNLNVNVRSRIRLLERVTLHTVIFLKILAEALGCQNIIDSFILVDAGEKYLKMNGY